MSNKKLILLVILFLFFIDYSKAEKNPIVLGNTRFTIITPELVRMEYSTNAKFIDEQTLFANNRSALSDSFKIEVKDGYYYISTRRLQIKFKNDGRPFSEKNISIVVINKPNNYTWQIRSVDNQNLGGTLSTLDDVSGDVPLEPGLLSKNGWKIIDDSNAEILKDGWIAERPVEHLKDLYFFAYGRDYKAALRALTTISGVVPMPRKNVLGSWYCRWWDYNADEFREVVNGYKEHDFPLDILVMDMGWHTQKEATTGTGHADNYGWTGYTWNKKLFPDPDQLIKELKNDHIDVSLNDHPHDGIRHHEAQYANFMRSLNEDTIGQKELQFNAGDKRYMDAFFKYALTPIEKQGVNFWWLDWQQNYIYPHVLGYRSLQNLPWLNHLYYQHSCSGDKRGLIFSRWGGWGSQRYPIQFSGDAKVNWEVLKFEVKFTASSSNSGCFFWAHDVGGFWGERNPELYIRWTQLALTNASLRIHSVMDPNLDRRPWLWGDEGTKSMGLIYHTRSMLMPYIYSSVWQCHSKTLPLVRPIYLEYPNDEQAYNQPQEYMFGDIFLAAPITQQGKGNDKIAAQKVWFPEGQWYHFFNGKKYSGNSTDSVFSTIYETPLFVKGGIPIPMQTYTQRMTSKKIDTLIVRCYPGTDGSTASYELYEDDGISKDYESSKFAITKLVYEQKKGLVQITINPCIGKYNGQLEKRAYRVELPNTIKAKYAIVNEKKVAIKYNPEQSANIIEVSSISINDKIVIKVETGEKGS